MIARLALGIAFVFAAAPAIADDKAELKTPEKLKELRKERRDLLKKALPLRILAIGSGSTVPEISQLSKDLLEAELALAARPEERIAAHKARLDTAKKVEETMAALYKADQASKTDSMLAQADRIAAEIGWLEAGGEEKKAKKDK